MRRLVALMALFVPLWGADEYEAQRLRMVREQIEARGVRNPSVLKAMRTAPRHVFVPPEARGQAYGDHPVSIGEGQTISQPYIVALMTELLDVQPNDKVLEIGTGSGYQAAILSQLAKEVYTIEIVPELARRSREVLRQQGYANVFVRQGDGYLGWPDKAPFDRIILTAAPPDVPKALTDQLNPGGKLVAPVGVGIQELVVIEKRPDGSLSRKKSVAVRFVPMVRGK
jgi:protein-L-isoaspartate(D-aspartate) O-methyltransferase